MKRSVRSRAKPRRAKANFRRAKFNQRRAKAKARRAKFNQRRAKAQQRAKAKARRAKAQQRAKAKARRAKAQQRAKAKARRAKFNQQRAKAKARRAKFNPGRVKPNNKAALNKQLKRATAKVRKQGKGPNKKIYNKNLTNRFGKKDQAIIKQLLDALLKQALCNLLGGGPMTPEMCGCIEDFLDDPDCPLSEEGCGEIQEELDACDPDDPENEEADW
jgi:hypothetical protein